MASVSVSVSDELKKKLEENNIINWSAVARKAFEEHLSKIELLDKLTANSNATDKDIEKLGAKIKAGIARAHEKKLSKKPK